MSRERPGLSWPERRRETHYDGRDVLCFVERPRTLHALLEAALARNPDGEALVGDGRRWSYRALDAEIGRVAAGLAAHGLGKGDRLALLIGNRPEFIIAMFAAARLGAIWTPLNVRDQTPGMRHMLRDSSAKILIAEAALAPRAPDPSETPALEHRFILGGARDGFAPYEALRSHGARDEATPVDEEDPAIILYTSGTTGLPKGAVLTGLGIAHSVIHFAAAMALTPEDRTVISVPLGHVTGCIAMAATLVHAAGAIVLMEAFKAADFLALTERERMTHTVLVPAQYALLLMQPTHRAFDLSAWRIGGFGGAPMPPETIRRLSAWLPGLSTINAYGATETTSPATIMPGDLTAAHLDSVGLTVGCGEIRVVDDAGADVPQGEAGEVWIGGPMVTPGYWGNPEATAREFTEGFWRSGDIGSKDADGFIRVFDRKKDMINRGGLKIYTTEVENVLATIDSIAEATVIAKPCPVLGERVHAVIVPRPGATLDLDAITRRCAEELSDYKVPESFTILEEGLPRNPNGKVLKRALREQMRQESREEAG